jgi:two-component system, OmpR family, alkaline phosphatase synthesis response regulator PhoP
MPRKILVVDDKKEMRTLLKQYLSQEGFEVFTAADGQQALFIARQEEPDLILLDLMMPEMSGYEFMRIFSREADVPVIILTAKIEENDKVLGLELGADDYITKPFSLRELTARVRAVIRRTDKSGSSASSQKAPGKIFAADIILDRGSHQVTVRDQEVNLTPSEFEILAALMSSPGRAYTRLELLDHLQGTSFEGYERTIDVHIRNLRSKIEPGSNPARYIETVYGVGYRFTTARRDSEETS